MTNKPSAVLWPQRARATFTYIDHPGGSRRVDRRNRRKTVYHKPLCGYHSMHYRTNSIKIRTILGLKPVYSSSLYRWQSYNKRNQHQCQLHVHGIGPDGALSTIHQHSPRITCRTDLWGSVQSLDRTPFQFELHSVHSLVLARRRTSSRVLLCFAWCGSCTTVVPSNCGSRCSFQVPVLLWGFAESVRCVLCQGLAVNLPRYMGESAGVKLFRKVFRTRLRSRT